MCSIMGYKGKLQIECFQKGFEKTKSRGPDMSKILPLKEGFLGFHRLAIMGLSEKGMQPFEFEGNYVVCNGEIYGFRKIKEELENKGYKFTSSSDCEILLPLYKEKGVNMFKELDAEFALIIYDKDKDALVAARDPIGIRPLYYGYDVNNDIVFASEAKNLVGIVSKIFPFPPGHYYEDGKFICYNDITKVESYNMQDIETICSSIHDLLIEGVKKRLDADAPIGFLLSGGLDSSLVCAISQKILNKPIETYAIGMSQDAIDLKYAKQVSEYIGSNHHEIIMTKEEVIASLEEVIAILGTYDITTIRASMGMYLLCKAIHNTSTIRVLLTGEISDELFGYKYTDFAPDAESFELEAEKRIKELYMYDVLRADRCISSNSMEGRVPFGDLDFVKYVMAINPELKMNHYHMGKYLLRHAFEKDHILPENILFRDKAAFSDAVGHSLVDDIKEYAESYYTDEEFKEKCSKYSYHAPYTKESLLYREIFESFYPNMDKLIVDYWLPNQSWPGCQINDPSARYLSNYGKSGE